MRNPPARSANAADHAQMSRPGESTQSDLPSRPDRVRPTHSAVDDGLLGELLDVFSSVSATSTAPAAVVTSRGRSEPCSDRVQQRVCGHVVVHDGRRTGIVTPYCSAKPTRLASTSARRATSLLHGAASDLRLAPTETPARRGSPPLTSRAFGPRPSLQQERAAEAGYRGWSV